MDFVVDAKFVEELGRLILPVNDSSVDPSTQFSTTTIAYYSIAGPIAATITANSSVVVLLDKAKAAPILLLREKNS